MVNVRQEQNMRWQVLFRLHEIFLSRPAAKLSIEQLKDEVQDAYSLSTIYSAVIYLMDKGLVKARVQGDSLGDIVDIRISSLGVDYVETAIQDEQANKNKRPVGFGKWHEITYKVDANLKEDRQKEQE